MTDSEAAKKITKLKKTAEALKRNNNFEFCVFADKDAYLDETPTGKNKFEK